MPDLVPEGLSILAGKPKTGKSWMALDFAVAVAAGSTALGNVDCDQGAVLLLALEDTERRLNGRLKAVLQGEPAPATLEIATQWPRADEGGLGELEGWLAKHSGARLVVVDTLALIRGRPDQAAGVYRDDYQAVSQFKKIVKHPYEAGDACIIQNACVHQHINTGDSQQVALVMKAKPLFLFMHMLFQKIVDYPPSTPVPGTEDYQPPSNL